MNISSVRFRQAAQQLLWISDRKGCLANREDLRRHRHLTHSIVGVAGFTGLAWLAVKYRYDIAGKVGLAVFLTLIVAGGLCAFGVRRHFADVVAVAATVALVVTGPLAFTTGTRPEVWVVGPVLAAGLCLLFCQAFQLGVISVKLS